METLKLEAKHMIAIKETAFQKDSATRLLRSLIKQPIAVTRALENTDLRFTLIPQERRAIRVG
jgi:hypothetical protein